MALVAQAGQLHRFQLVAQMCKLRQQGQMLVQVLAPGNLLFHRNRCQAHVGRELVARVQDFLCSGFSHAHFAFNH